MSKYHYAIEEESIIAQKILNRCSYCVWFRYTSNTQESTLYASCELNHIYTPMVRSVKLCKLFNHRRDVADPFTVEEFIDVHR